VLIGADARLIDMIQRIMPTRYEAITRALSRRGT
jgi:hypothetical protein